MILVFSGTGNSKYIADALADRLGDEAISLNDIIKNSKERTFDSDTPFVIVSPIYAWRYPGIVEDFIGTAEFTGNKNIYFLATMGENSGNCDRFVTNLARIKGLDCMGFRGIVMPNNYVIDSVMESDEVNDAIIAKAIPQVEEIAQAIKSGKHIQKTDKTKMAGLLSGPVHNMFTKHMHSADKYVVSDDCISCGKCERLCVTNNITLSKGEKPSFGSNCINCYACLQYCPKQAINIEGKTENHGRYTCRQYTSECKDEKGLKEQNDMSLSASEMKELEKECGFLTEAGFRKEAESRFITFTRNLLQIAVGCEPGDNVKAFIKFTDINATYDVGFIGTARDHRNFDAPSQLERGVLLMGYLKDNFDNLTNKTYCEESREYIEQYLTENRVSLDKARNDFINRLKANG